MIRRTNAQGAAVLDAATEVHAGLAREDFYRRLIEVEVASSANPAAVSDEDYETRLRAIEQSLQAEKIPMMYSNELYVLREHIELARG